MAFVLGPTSPLASWMSELAAQVARSPAFFLGKPVVLDLSAASPEDSGLESLVASLQELGVRLIGVEGIDRAIPGAEALAQPLSYGRTTDLGALAEPAPLPPPSFMLRDEPVRSGQSLAFPSGDVTIMGSVASGAEVLAGGSIHVYGALRGRAIAGAAGDGRARIFCRRLEAELLAIDGLYMTAEAMPSALRGRAVQARLEGEAIIIAALD